MSNNGWVKCSDPNSGRTFYANHLTRETQWDPPPDFVDPDDVPTSVTKPASVISNGSVSGGFKSAMPVQRVASSSSVASLSISSHHPYNSNGLDSSSLSINGGSSFHTHTGFGRSDATQASGIALNRASSQPLISDINNESPLPSNWEKMQDASSGRSFYVDHVRKITTWEHPGLSASSDTSNGGRASSGAINPTSDMSIQNNGGASGMSTGFGFISADSLDPHSSANTANLSSSVHGHDTNSITSNGRQANTNTNGLRWHGNLRHPPPTANGHHNANDYGVEHKRPGLQSEQSYTRGLYSQDVEDFHTVSSTTHSHHSVNDDQSSHYYSGTGGDGSSDSALKHIDFTVVNVSDHLRPACPSCNVIFSIPLKRRHHCRLCGDVFCDSCSPHRVLLPLDGPQFEKPVRVCEVCNLDVDRGNYFSMRRYLTPLQLFDPDNYMKSGPEIGFGSSGSGLAGEDKEQGGIGPNNVAAALSALSQDLDSVLLDSSSFSEKVTIPAKVLVPAITRHLALESTSDRAIRALSSLLALGNVVGDDSFAHAVFMQNDAESVLDNILGLLELSGSSRKLLAIQEQASRTLFYLSDAKMITSLLAKDDGMSLPGGVDDEGEPMEGSAAKAIESFDIHRTLRNMLDHTTSSVSPSLQRWAAASIRNLVTEDQRRACDAVALAMTSGSFLSNNKLRYESFTSQLVSTGGVMILSSLMGVDDSDTRAHATAALSATIVATRAIDTSLAMFKEASGGSKPETDITRSDAAIVSAIVGSGGCDVSLAQLLLSADDAVAGMGCAFALSLVNPLLRDPRASSLSSYHVSASSTNDKPIALDKNEDGLGSYREAAIALASNSGILTALFQLVGEPAHRGRNVRSLDLKRCAMEVLAAIALTLSYWNGKFKLLGKSAGNDWKEFMHEVDEILSSLQQERLEEVALRAYSSVTSLNTSRDSPSSQLREASSLVMGAIASCSTAATTNLSAKHAVTSLITVAGDEGLANESVLRGEWASRNLAMLEATSSILVQGWKPIQQKMQVEGTGFYEDSNELDNENLIPSDNNMHVSNDYSASGDHSSIFPNASTSTSLDLLLEALDAGIVPLVSRIINAKIEYHNNDKAYANIRLKIACSHIVAAIFGIGRCDETSIGFSRLYEAINISSSSNNFNYGQQSEYGNFRGDANVDKRKMNNLISSAVSLLQSTAMHTQNYVMNQQPPDRQLPLVELLEACLLAVGSICGALVCAFSSRIDPHESQGVISTSSFSAAIEDEFVSYRQDACVASCPLLVNNSFLPSALVGAFGEGSVLPALRLALAIAQNGPLSVHSQLAHSGMLIPVSDMLRDALVAGDRFVFSASLALIRFCGPHITANTGENGGIKSLRQSIQLITHVLVINENKNSNSEQLRTLRALKKESILALEGLSINASLWGAITNYAVPHLSKYLMDNKNWDEDNIDRCATLCAALRTIQRIIPLPSHAVSAARTGIGKSLSELICGRKDTDNEGDKKSLIGRTRALKIDRQRKKQHEMSNNVQLLALEVLHTLSSHTTARRGDDKGAIGLIHCGAVKAVCFSLANNATVPTDTLEGSSTTSTVSITKFGLELFQYLLSDIDNPDDPQPAQVNAFVEAVARQYRFIRTLCATMLLASDDGSLTSSDQPSSEHYEDVNTKNKGNETFSIAPLYGQPLLLYEGACVEFSSPLNAAISTLFSIAAHCSVVDSPSSETFWDTFLMKEDRKLLDSDTKQATAAAACAVFLNVLIDEDEGICVPRNPLKREYYRTVALPLVRKRLLDGLESNLMDFFSLSKSDGGSSSSIFSLLQRFHLPQTCLALCSDPKLIDSAFQAVESMLSEFSEDILPLMVSDKHSLMSLLDFLSFHSGNELVTTRPEKIKRFAAQILSTAGETGILGPTVIRLGLRSEAIASISAACAFEETVNDDDIDEDIGSSAESTSSLCLTALVGILSDGNKEITKGNKGNLSTATGREELKISPSEAKAISSTLGKKLSEMVLARFIKDAEDKNNDNESESGTKVVAVTESAEVLLLCALASSKEAIPDLCLHGGLEALSLVAAEGEISAIKALKEACKDDPTLVLDVEGHVSAMHVITDNNEKHPRAVEIACIDFLATLCVETKKGRYAISEAELCNACIDFASKTILQLINTHDKKSANVESNPRFQENQKEKLESSYSDTKERINESATRKVDEMGDSGKSIIDLEVGAMSFLTSLIHVKKCREILFHNEELQTAIFSLSSSKSIYLQYCAVNFLVSSARYIIDGSMDYTYNVQSLSSIFLSILKSPSFDRGDKSTFTISSLNCSLLGNSIDSRYLNKNQVFASVCSAIDLMFYHIPQETISEIVSVLIPRFSKILDNQTSSSKRTSNNMHNSGKLICNMTSIFLRLIGSAEHLNIMLKLEVFYTSIRLVLLAPGEVEDKERMEPGDNLHSLDEYMNWKCALIQILQCLCVIIAQPFPGHEGLLSWEEVISDVEATVKKDIFTRKVKKSSITPPAASNREFMNFSSTLKKFARDLTDPTRAVLARRLLEYMTT